MGAIISGGNCKHPEKATASDFFGGAAHGFLGMFGLGELVDPLGDAHKDIQSALSDINSTTAAMSLKLAQKQSIVTEEVFKNLNMRMDLMGQLTQEQNDQVLDSIKQENLFLSILSMLVVILIFFFLIQKKCC